ncbi:MAG: hypothetical protein ACRCZD_16465, partial [Phycicoccus sp.]
MKLRSVDATARCGRPPRPGVVWAFADRADGDAAAVLGWATVPGTRLANGTRFGSPDGVVGTGSTCGVLEI